MKDPLLSEYELTQPGVQKIIDWFNTRLDKHRVDNDHLNASPLLRGRIAEIKDFNSAIDPKKKTHDTAKRNAMQS